MRAKAVAYGVLIVAVLGLLVWVAGKSGSDGQVAEVRRVGNGNTVASNSGGEGIPGDIPTVPAPFSTSFVPVPQQTGETAFSGPPNPVATQEAIIRQMSATPTPTATPTATHMPAGWEELERLADGPYMGGEEDDKRIKELDAYLGSLPGKVIAQGEGTSAVCYQGPSGYRIEEVLLPGFVTFYRRERFITNRYWKIAITGGPFPVTQYQRPYTLIVNGSTYFFELQPTADKKELRMLVMQPPLGGEGATLAVKYESELVVELPVKLHYMNGRSEQANIAPTSTLEPGTTAYKTMMAGQGYDEPTPYSTSRAQLSKYDREMDLLYSTAGKVIAENQYPVPKCASRLQRLYGGRFYEYKIEEIELPESVTLTESVETPVTISKFWRMSIDDMDPEYIEYVTNSIPVYETMCVGGKAFEVERKNGYRYGYGKLRGILFEISALHEGDPISLAFWSRYQGAAEGCSSPSQAMLPEKLHFLSNSATVEPPAVDPTAVACDERIDMFDMLLKTPGRIIGEGSNTFASCQLQVKSYRVEEVILPRKTKFVLPEYGPKAEEVIETDKFWRLVITAEKSYRNWGVVWLDGNPIQVYPEGLGSEGSEITALIFDRNMLREGSTIRFSNIGETIEGELPGEELPEKMHLNKYP